MLRRVALEADCLGWLLALYILAGWLYAVSLEDFNFCLCRR